MAITSSMVQKATAHTLKRTFSRETSVNIEIQADPSIIWTLLTNAADFSRWNSTIISIDGNIRPGGKISLRSTLDPKRVFKLKIRKFIQEKELVWGDAMGNRVFTIYNNDRGYTQFSMTEKIGGPLFPLFARMIPPFDRSFEQFAADLKKEAESINSIK